MLFALALATNKIKVCIQGGNHEKEMGRLYVIQGCISDSPGTRCESDSETGTAPRHAMLNTHVVSW